MEFKHHLALSRADLTAHAFRIASAYSGRLTVRQLYYQFVSEGLFSPTGQKNKSGKTDADLFYDRLTETITQARMEGALPFDWIEDRTREAKQSAFAEFSTDVDAALANAASYIRSMPNWTLRMSRWHRQPYHVTVGVEKEALAGVFEDVCAALGVGMFVFRGYASVSSLYQYAKNLAEAQAAGFVEEAVLLYFGDHDPDGWEIPRSAVRVVEEIAEAEGLEIPHLQLKRQALNMDQIRRYNPPPFAAKVSSSRCPGYVKEHGTDRAWELDALKPNQLEALIRGSVADHFDEGVHDRYQDEIDSARAVMRERMRRPEWLDGVFS